MIINWLAAGFGAMCMLGFKLLWGEIKDIQRSVDSFKDMAVYKEDHRSDLTEIKALMQRILDRLDTKQDKV